jgi:hypothetical protein
MKKTMLTESQIVETWTEEYNLIRPHEALQGLSPYQFASQNSWEFLLSIGTNFGRLTKRQCPKNHPSGLERHGSLWARWRVNKFQLGDAIQFHRSSSAALIAGECLTCFAPPANPWRQIRWTSSRQSFFWKPQIAFENRDLHKLL